MSRPALYLSRTLPDPVMAVIRERFRLTAEPSVDQPSPAMIRAGLREAEAAICTLTERIDEDVLGGAPDLRVIANYAVGYDNISLDAARARGIVVTNTPDVLTDATADLTWALILSTARRILEGHALAQGGAWRGWEPTQLLGAEVSGQTLGIIGMGRIGRAVARRAIGFNMAVLYSSPNKVDPTGPEERGWLQAQLEQLLSGSDFISLHTPLRPATVHLIGADQLRLMRPTAFLINTSRGPVIDEAALVEALQAGRLAGAGLDVYEREPRIHPGLRALPQVVMLPHVGSASLRTRTRMGMICLDNVSAVLGGSTVPNRVA